MIGLSDDFYLGRTRKLAAMLVKDVVFKFSTFVIIRPYVFFWPAKVVLVNWHVYSHDSSITL